MTTSFALFPFLPPQLIIVAPKKPFVTAYTDRVILVACSKTKHRGPCEARLLYNSPLFKKSRALAEASGSPWLILSAKHGLVHPNRVLQSYDESLDDLDAKDRRIWAKNVLSQLEHIAEITPSTKFVGLAGSLYLDPLRVEGLEVLDVLAGQQIGERLHSLTAWLNRTSSVPSSLAPSLTHLRAGHFDPTPKA